jgi:hypothetical protein
MTYRSFTRLIAAAIVAAPLALSGCSGSDGKNGVNGTNGTNGASTGTVEGTVSIAGTSPALVLAGLTVGVDPAVAGLTVTTDSAGFYTADLPIGVYTLTFQATGFGTVTKSVSVTAAQTATQDVALTPTVPVLLSLQVTGAAAPGATLNAVATVTTFDGSTPVAGSESWTQTHGAAAAIATPGAAATDVTLAADAEYKVELFKSLTVSPIQDLDDDPAVGGEGGTPFQGGLQDRFKVQGVTHFDVERAGHVSLQFQVQTSSGTYTATTDVATALPWGPSTGLAQVPVGEAVVIHGKCINPDAVTGACQGPWDFALTAPASSAAALDDATAQNPSFVPDVAGTYTLVENGTAVTMDIVAANWVGAIDAAATLAALDASGAGTPVGSGNCTVCHAPGGGGLAPDQFTPWSQSGHASILTQNLNAGGHYSEACFDCHTVGFNKAVTNGGIDEKADYAAMLAGLFTSHGSPVANPLNWKTLLTDYPATAAMTNIQCENCHGPNGGHTGNAAEKARRASIEASVCARCHGEPARHGRYQEWQLSRHSTYDIAVGEGFSGTPPTVRSSCAGCHTGQGFLLWSKQIMGGNPSRTINATDLATLNATMTPENVQPQTCAVCHDPHDPGTTSSLGNNVKLRIQDNTPMLPGGFQAVGVGKGAICISCHNSRNGEAVGGSGIVALHEDGDATFGTLTGYSAPHEACQGDVLMGRNAYFVNGVRGAHSNIINTCTACHMESVAPPPELGYPTATNHIFEANLTVCAKCHGAFDGAGLQASVEAELVALEKAIEDAVARVYAPGSTVVYTSGRQPRLSIDGAAAVAFTAVIDPATSPINTDILAKANWNYSLIEQDFSKGVHNPSFAHDVLFATMQRVNAITTAQ